MMIPRRQENFPPCYIEIGSHRCTGCAACSNGCQQSAIEMSLTAEGFYRPFLLNGKCNGCLLCQHFCPISSIERILFTREDKIPEVFAAWSVNENTHLKSSSGGIFFELAYSVLERKGVVCGCKWINDWTPTHVLVENRSELDALRGSKYVPSYISNDLFRKIISLTKLGVPVLFCGTPCQVAGLRTLYNSKSTPINNLTLVDLVCHGVPSLTSFWRYLDWKFGGRDVLESFSFRNKEITTQTICAIDKSGNKYLKTCGKNSWFRSAMVYHLFLQTSCYSCPFGNIPRVGDITLGDFWGITKAWHNPHGDSAVYINTSKGKELLETLVNEGKINVKLSDYASISKHIDRIRGVNYQIPMLRKFAFILIKMNKYGVFNLLCYLPMKSKEWMIGSINRRISWFTKHVSGKLL